MTDCGGLLVFEELLTAVHLHFNAVLLNLLMQFASQLCCHLIPSAIQTNSKKPSSFNHFNCHEILVFIITSESSQLDTGHYNPPPNVARHSLQRFG